MEKYLLDPLKLFMYKTHGIKYKAIYKSNEFIMTKRLNKPVHVFRTGFYHIEGIIR